VDAGHIPGSAHEPYHDIHGIPNGIDPAKPVAVICGSGQRSAVAAGLLQRYGGEHVIHVVEGGVPLWKREGWLIEPPEKAWLLARRSVVGTMRATPTDIRGDLGAQRVRAGHRLRRRRERLTRDPMAPRPHVQGLAPDDGSRTAPHGDAVLPHRRHA
jgi:hypothetical protein